MIQKIIEALSKYPEFLQTKDLVALGLFVNQNAAHQTRKRKIGPNYIKIQKKILYPKIEVIEWINKNYIAQ